MKVIHQPSGDILVTTDHGTFTVHNTPQGWKINKAVRAWLNEGTPPLPGKKVRIQGYGYRYFFDLRKDIRVCLETCDTPVPQE